MERTIFASRWLLAPFYVGLAVSLVVLNSLIVLILLVFLAIGAACGIGAKTITSIVDGIKCCHQNVRRLQRPRFSAIRRVAPEVISAAYRVADSLPYSALIVVFPRRYDKEAGVGTVVAMILPYAVVVSVIWILLFLTWELHYRRLSVPWG